jgi:hypothetical protein
MSKAGLSKSGIELLGYLERKEVRYPASPRLVAHHDDLHVETLGTMPLGDPAPMGRDAIFRIASLAKAITAAAAMILIEECKLRLTESIGPWIPERLIASCSSQVPRCSMKPCLQNRAITFATCSSSDGVRQCDGAA